jgi:hypothetical protein
MHTHLKNRSTEATLIFDAPGSLEVTVVWKTDGQSRKKRVKYTGTITLGDGNEHTVSLYTLGIQGRLWDVKLTLTAGAAWIQRPVGWEKQMIIGDAEKIDKTGVVPNGNSLPPDESEIWSIRFTGTITVDVESLRRRHFVDVAFKEGHDEAPPPPDPGGEEGGEEEEEEEEEEDGGEYQPIS